MQIRRHHDSQAGTGVDVDVRKDASLTDELEVDESFEQGRADRGALADEHEHLSVAQSLRQFVDVVGVVIPHRHFVVAELLEAVKRRHCVEVVVENADPHGTPTSDLFRDFQINNDAAGNSCIDNGMARGIMIRRNIF
jgi:hypothetical protein